MLELSSSSIASTTTLTRPPPASLRELMANGLVVACTRLWNDHRHVFFLEREKDVRVYNKLPFASTVLQFGTDSRTILHVDIGVVAVFFFFVVVFFPF
jgi:hypothetical protein